MKVKILQDLRKLKFKDMNIKKLTSNKKNILDGVYIIKPKVFEDERGFFYESWNQSSFNDLLGEEIIFKQDNHSSSHTGVLRGLHYQIQPYPQGKLVRCTKGSIFDVAVDIRKSSPTFGEWTSIVLDNINKLMIWIPVGFAHGFLSLDKKTEVIYKSSELWSKEQDRSIRWNDKDLNINWPIEQINISSPNLSFKDANAPYLKDAEILN